MLTSDLGQLSGASIEVLLTECAGVNGAFPLLPQMPIWAVHRNFNTTLE